MRSFETCKTRVAAFALALVLCALLCLACALPGAAFADETENLVNPQQMPDSSFIYDTDLADLASADAYLDNRTVQVSGEAIGDIIYSEVGDDRCWVLIESEKGDAVSVYMTKESAALIDTLGAYGKKGTTLQVRGTFHLACQEHDGLSDLHADSVSVVKKGSSTAESFNLALFIPGVFFLVIGLFLTGLFRYLRERQR